MSLIHYGSICCRHIFWINSKCKIDQVNQHLMERIETGKGFVLTKCWCHFSMPCDYFQEFAQLDCGLLSMNSSDQRTGLGCHTESRKQPEFHFLKWTNKISFLKMLPCVVYFPKSGGSFKTLAPFMLQVTRNIQMMFADLTTAARKWRIWLSHGCKTDDSSI